ncbi:MAG: M20/M25/M40 family metallo-hydrolase [Elusimicrobia bacterium]|nr:M20/M25/M40 family metallo-hydrolase [Elusimicrobiota bacterium]
MRLFLSALFFLGSFAAQVEARGDFLERQSREFLGALIRLDTSNPPGNEIIAANYLKNHLDQAGIESRIYTSTGTRSSLIARLKSSGAKRPLVLMCHSDVVPADPKEWSTPPFEAVEKGGYLYGRGAADIKSMCAVELAILLHLHREKIPLQRDVIFFAQADEENGGGDRHIEWLLKNHWDAFGNAEFAVNEGGETAWNGRRVTEVRVQAAEKEYLDIKFEARGESGHSSIPREGNPVVSVARAVARLGDYKAPARLLDIVRQFLSRQAELTQDRDLRKIIEAVLKAKPGPELDEAADRLAVLKPDFAAMLRDTLVPTILQAGYKPNVVPASAQAVLNARLLPGRSVEAFIQELVPALEDPVIEINYEASKSREAGPMPTDTELYRSAQSAAKKVLPGAAVMPFMSAWTTDSQDLRARGVIVYGIDPPLSADDAERVHGKDERINLEALDLYAKYLLEIVLQVAKR